MARFQEGDTKFGAIAWIENSPAADGEECEHDSNSVEYRDGWS